MPSRVKAVEVVGVLGSRRITGCLANDHPPVGAGHTLEELGSWDAAQVLPPCNVDGRDAVGIHNSQTLLHRLPSHHLAAFRPGFHMAVPAAQVALPGDVHLQNRDALRRERSKTRLADTGFEGCFRFFGREPGELGGGIQLHFLPLNDLADLCGVGQRVARDHGGTHVHRLHHLVIVHPQREAFVGEGIYAVGTMPDRRHRQGDERLLALRQLARAGSLVVVLKESFRFGRCELSILGKSARSFGS